MSETVTCGGSLRRTAVVADSLRRVSVTDSSFGTVTADGGFAAVTCSECGEVKQRIDEALVSGFVGHLCTNDDCPVDS